MAAKPTIVLRLPEVRARTGCSRSTIYARLSDPNSDFPRPIKLGPRAIGWIESEIDDWILKRIEQSRSKPATRA